MGDIVFDARPAMLPNLITVSGNQAVELAALLTPPARYAAAKPECIS